MVFCLITGDNALFEGMLYLHVLKIKYHKEGTLTSALLLYMNTSHFDLTGTEVAYSQSPQLDLG